MCDCELPEAMRRLTRRARTQHECCECGGTIEPGTQYEYVSGIWDGHALTFKTCAECVGIRHWYVTECLPAGECHPCFGDLVQDATDYGNEGTRADLLLAASAAGYL